MKYNIIREKSYKFALKIIDLCKLLKDNKEFVLADQLMRSGTSVAANVEEAIGGESRADFIHKMSIAYKEARETNFWIKLLVDSKRLPNEDLNIQISENEEILKILTTIIKNNKDKIEK